METKYIEIDKPKDLYNKKTAKEIERLAKIGLNGREITLLMHFVTSDECLKEIMNDFRKIKNRIYFELDNR